MACSPLDRFILVLRRCLSECIVTVMALTETLLAVQEQAVKLAEFCLKASHSHVQIIKTTKRPWGRPGLRNLPAASSDAPLLSLERADGDADAGSAGALSRRSPVSGHHRCPVPAPGTLRPGWNPQGCVQPPPAGSGLGALVVRL